MPAPREQHLDARQRNADLVEQLDELAVDALFLALGHPPRLPSASAGYSIATMR